MKNMRMVVAMLAALGMLLSSLSGLVSAQGGMSMGAFYFVVTNNGDEADRLVSIQTDAAETIEVHEVVMNDGVMQMQPLEDGLEIPAGEAVTLEPGGFHVMMIGLTDSLMDGNEFTATLTFETAGDVEVTVPIMASDPADGEGTAGPFEAGDLVIEGVWARQAPKIEGAATPIASPMASPESGMHDGSGHGADTGMSMGAFYFVVTNNGDEADRLVSVQTGAAETAEIHEVVMNDGVMQMQPLEDGLEIPAGETVSLEPGGFHVMMIGLTDSLMDGNVFTATLTFETAGDVEVTVPIMASEPTDGEGAARPFEDGDLVIEGVWARQAPRIDASATPEN